jgi:hypothetical protein
MMCNFTNELCASTYHIFFQANDGHLGQIKGSNGTWTYEQIPYIPQTGAILYGFAAGSVAHVFVLERASFPSSIIDVSWDSTNGWLATNVGAITQAPPARFVASTTISTPLTGFAAPDGSVNVFYITRSSHLGQLKWTSSLGWKYYDLTTAAGTVNVSGTYSAGPGLTSYIDSSGPHIYFQGSDQHFHQLIYTSHWVDQDLTNASGTTNSNPPIASFSLGGTAHVWWNIGHIHELNWSSAQGWKDHDISQEAGSPVC